MHIPSDLSSGSATRGVLLSCSRGGLITGTASSSSQDQQRQEFPFSRSSREWNVCTARRLAWLSCANWCLQARPLGHSCDTCLDLTVQDPSALIRNVQQPHPLLWRPTRPSYRFDSPPVVTVDSSFLCCQACMGAPRELPIGACVRPLEEHGMQSRHASIIHHELLFAPPPCSYGLGMMTTTTTMMGQSLGTAVRRCNTKPWGSKVQLRIWGNGSSGGHADGPSASQPTHETPSWPPKAQRRRRRKEEEGHTRERWPKGSVRGLLGAGGDVVEEHDDEEHGAPQEVGQHAQLNVVDHVSWVNREEVVVCILFCTPTPNQLK